MPDPITMANARYSGSGSHQWVRATVELGLVLHAVLIPISIAGAQLAMAIVFAGWLAGLVAGERPRFLSDPLLVPILIFVVATAVAAAFSDDPGRGFWTMRGDWILLFYLIERQTIRTPRMGRRVLSAFVLSAGVSGAYAVWQFFHGWDYVRSHPLEVVGIGHMATGFLGHHLTYGGMMLLAFLAAFAMSFYTRPGPLRGFLIGATLLTGAGVLLSFARTAWMGAMGGLVVVALMVGRRGFVGVGAVFLAGVTTVFLSPDLRGRLVGLREFADYPRIRLWRTSLAIARDHPWVGAGPGSWPGLFPTYKVPGQYNNTGHPHNDILNQLVQVGIIGVLAWCFLFWRILREAWRRWRGNRPTWMAGLPAATLAAVAGLLIGGMGQCFYTDEEVAMALWLVIACGLCVPSALPVGESE